MHIKNVKSIKDLTFSFPLEKGLYAITGENASGKSTLIACASYVFFNTPLNKFFGRPAENASIEFALGDAIRKWEYIESTWQRSKSQKRMKIDGFYEGSIVFGNRFRDSSLNALQTLDMIKSEDISPADEFVRKNLGIILHDDATYYSQLFSIRESVKQKLRLRGHPYFYQVEDGTIISQARMSTGENLLITILHSLNLKRFDRMKYDDGRPLIIFLDEIELALHPSALRRLLLFLKYMSDQLNAAIFFSTHSPEMLRGIKAQNIFYLDRQFDGTIMITNPCYPAFAARSLYSDDGYGDDVVVFVEDDLAKSLLERILIEKDLLHSIRLKILAAGGWTNTLVLARDVVMSRVLLRGTKVIVVLDKDIQSQVPDFLNRHKDCKFLEPDFLPISSLEKYLKRKLVDEVDHALYRKLDNYVFCGRPLSSILSRYHSENDVTQDSDGKSLYGVLINELRSIKKDRDGLVEVVVKHLMDTEQTLIKALSVYMTKKISEDIQY